VVSRWRAGFYGASRFIVRVFLSVFFRPRAYGQGNVPEHGGALLLSNHQSYLDPVLIGAFSPRRLLYMARLTLFTNPVFGGLIRLLGVFPVKRGRPDRGSIRLAIRHLQSGEIVVMFPEGTRTPDGELQRVKGGFKLLVGKASVPVIPVALDGAHRVWSRWRALPRPGRIRVMYGPVIPPEEFDGLTDREAADRVGREFSFLLRKLRRLP